MTGGSTRRGMRSAGSVVLAPEGMGRPDAPDHRMERCFREGARRRDRPARPRGRRGLLTSPRAGAQARRVESTRPDDADPMFLAGQVRGPVPRMPRRRRHAVARPFDRPAQAKPEKEGERHHPTGRYHLGSHGGLASSGGGVLSPPMLSPFPKLSTISWATEKGSCIVRLDFRSIWSAWSRRQRAVARLDRPLMERPVRPQMPRWDPRMQFRMSVASHLLVKSGKSPVDGGIRSGQRGSSGYVRHRGAPGVASATAGRSAVRVRWKMDARDAHPTGQGGKGGHQ